MALEWLQYREDSTKYKGGGGDKFRRKYRREGVQLYTRPNFFNFSICKFNFLNTQETVEYFGNRSTIRRMRNIN